MQIDDNKKSRSTLKSYFIKNAIPTETQFSQLMDSVLNQRDDGLVKAPGDPLSIEAVGDDVSFKRALNFYLSFADPDPAWSIVMRPRANPAAAATASLGWSLNDAAGVSRLCVDAATGNVGVGTTKPADKLTVEGRVRAGALSIGPWPANAGYVFLGSNLLNQADAGNYALLQGATSEPGVTYVNSPTRVGLRVANVDKLTVAADGVSVNGSVKVGGSDLYFTETGHTHTGFGNTIGFAAIENASDYEALMILGRSMPQRGGGFSRRVKVWDHLEVNGALVVKGPTEFVGDLEIRGKHALRGDDPWLRLNQDKQFTAGTHTPGLFAPQSLNVGGMNGWGNPGDNNAWIVGNLSVGTAQLNKARVQIEGDLFVSGRIGSMGKGPAPLTGGWGGGLRTWDVEVEATLWARNAVQTGPRDLAEIFFSEDALEAGDVVGLAEEGDGVGLARASEGSRVIGIVSSEPGFLLGSLHNREDLPDDGRTGHPIALTGCVPCKVSDEGGPIRRGDLITPASRPGYAMRAPEGGHAAGTVVGKALQAHDEGDGVIEVFVMLR